MIKQIFIVVLLLTSLLIAQEEYKPWIKGERERHAKSIQLQKIQYPGDSKIDITYYGLDLAVTYNPNYLVGNVTIEAKADTTEINTCFLDLRTTLTVDSVLLNGTATSFTHSTNKINITLDHTYTLGEPFILKVYYRGVPTGGGFYFGTHQGSPVIGTLSEPYSGPNWWPQKDTPADKADSSDVWITVADNLIPVSNGTLESITPNGNGTHTYHWKNHYTIANYLISLAITNYTQYDTYYHYSPTDSMVIMNFIYPEHFNSVKPLVDETDEMIEVFTDRYGEYPFIMEKYGHAEYQWGGAMEHQTISSMAFWGTGVISHELAHQWYGDMITCKDWHHIWLNEGFATYSEAVYLEARDGKAAYDNKIASNMSAAKNAVGTIWVQDIEDEDEIFDWWRSYNKGSCVLHMLRGVVGDSTFFDILRTYSADPSVSYGVATTEDFQAIAESVSGQDLDYFFQEWIFTGENYPKYNINWSKNSLGGDLYSIDLNIIQNVNSVPAFFTMPVEIKVNTSLGDTTVTLFNNAQNQNFQFNVNGNPASINFDPGNWILKDVLGVTNVEDLFVPLQFSLEQNYPNPFNPSTNIEYTIPESGIVTLKIYDILGKEVATLVNGQNDAGKHKVEFDATGFNSGVYFYRIENGSSVETKKLVLLK